MRILLFFNPPETDLKLRSMFMIRPPRRQGRNSGRSLGSCLEDGLIVFEGMWGRCNLGGVFVAGLCEPSPEKMKCPASNATANAATDFKANFACMFCHLHGPVSNWAIDS